MYHVLKGVDSIGSGKSSFIEYVVMNSKCKIRSVILMEDLSDWKSIPPVLPLTKEQSIASLKSISVLHAKFWKDKKILNESPNRAARNSKANHFRRKKIVNNIEKHARKLTEGDWKTYKVMKLPKNEVLPDWMDLNISGEFYDCELK